MASSFTGLGALARRVAVGTAWVVAVSAAAQSAWAGEIGPMTGAYEGKATCSGLQNGVPGKQKQEFTVKSPVLITQGPTNAVIDFPGLDPISAFIENNTQKEGQSIVSGIGCALDLTFDGATVFLNAKVKGDKVTLKGTLVILDDAENQSAICKVSLKRFDATNPIVDCPAG
jgi:hypothetical protein